MGLKDMVSLYDLAGAHGGAATSALMVGGNVPPQSNLTEEFSGETTAAEASDIAFD